MGAHQGKFHHRHRTTDDVDDDHYEDLPLDTDFDSVYDCNEEDELGRGTYAVVYMCTHRKSKRKRAVKVMSIHKMKQEDVEVIEEEVDILKSLQHRHIVRLYHVFRSSTHIYLVQELCQGGELFDRIVDLQHYSEHDAREAMHAMLSAICYAHGRGIVHRDLKPENILLAAKNDNTDLKLCDFGMAHRIWGLEPLKTVCGSPAYMSPEILSNDTGNKGEASYDEKVDVWALGTIMFCLLAGYNPFEDRSMGVMIAKIKRGVYNMRHSVFNNVSTEAKDLIRQMLAIDPNKRLSAQACLQHRWFALHRDELVIRGLDATKQKLKERLRGKKKLRAAADAIIMLNRLKVLSSGESLSGKRSDSGSSHGHSHKHTHSPHPDSNIRSDSSSSLDSTVSSLSSCSGMAFSPGTPTTTANSPYLTKLDCSQHLFPPKRTPSSISNISTAFYSTSPGSALSGGGNSDGSLDQQDASPVTAGGTTTTTTTHTHIHTHTASPPGGGKTTSPGGGAAHTRRTSSSSSFPSSPPVVAPGLRGLNEYYRQQRALKRQMAHNNHNKGINALNDASPFFSSSAPLLSPPPSSLIPSTAHRRRTSFSPDSGSGSTTSDTSNNHTQVPTYNKVPSFASAVSFLDETSTGSGSQDIITHKHTSDELDRHRHGGNLKEIEEEGGGQHTHTEKDTDKDPHSHDHGHNHDYHLGDQEEEEELKVEF